MTMTINTPQEFATRWLNLAQPRLGAKPLLCTDEWFAPAERMLNPDPAVFIVGKFDDHGKWMDGWETRRRRNGGYDHCIVKLGLPGVIKGVDIDTSHFTGNFPPAASLDACYSDGDPDDRTEWHEVIAAVSLQGNSHHYVSVEDGRPWTHVRLNIYPDGGVARLRVYGQVQCDWEKRDRNTLIDLCAVENGGRPVVWNDSHFGPPHPLLTPGRGVNMGDGWETRRRREPGNDWLIVELGHRGSIEEIVVDTAHFKGNYPDRCSIQAAWVTGGTEQSLVTQSMFWPVLLPEQKLQMDAIHTFKEQVQKIGPVSHVKLNIFPDGGISRLRLLGKIA
ncbi:allantoicase [Burkholderia guangdongensis]|uniref:allantoicase n=1 Tax=Burkholderia guangdongensis TaxID=1792500 RepID=UPI0015CBBA6A|nr:allantoicase [Burkholderia guangdongensis]